jgi:hypothetical protein
MLNKRRTDLTSTAKRHEILISEACVVLLTVFKLNLGASWLWLERKERDKQAACRRTASGK